jgi:hypothetical protein
MGKTCNNCNAESNMAMIPYIAHEEAIARQERQTKRLWVAIVIAIAIIFTNNVVWLIHDSNSGNENLPPCECACQCSETTQT